MTFTDALLRRLNRYSPIFIETGTNVGGGVEMASRNGFETILSCESDYNLYLEACHRLSALHINSQLFYGDSKECLAKMLQSVKDPAVVFLDAHDCSGKIQGSLLDELNVLATVAIKTNCILVDDVDIIEDLCGLTLNMLKEQLWKINRDYTFELTNGGRLKSLLIAYL
jgi:hypothetical protein